MEQGAQLLTDQVALVTGAGSGLGRQFARTLAGSGAAVAVAGRRRDRLESVVSEIEAAGGKWIAVELDVLSEQSIRLGVDLVQDRLGLPTILVNNAGVPDAERAHKVAVELVDRVIGTNLRGPWLLATDVARRLIAAGRPGRIVNISSMSAFH